MKRMIKSKNGFTLIEIVIVISIIVIISGATFVGIDAVLERANRNAQELEENHGANFEAEAWATVKNLSVDIDSFKETSETSITESESSETEETEPTETEPTASPNDRDQAFLDRKQELLDMGYLEDEIHIIYDEDGHIKSMSWRSTRRGIGGSGNATAGYMLDIDTSKPSWDMNTELSFDDPLLSCIISCPAGVEPKLAGENWQYELVSLGDGRYELKYLGDGNGRTPQTDFKLNLPGGSKIESFTSKK